jgi:hypothetical protein
MLLFSAMAVCEIAAPVPLSTRTVLCKLHLQVVSWDYQGPASRTVICSNSPTAMHSPKDTQSTLTEHRQTPVIQHPQAPE